MIKALNILALLVAAHVLAWTTLASVRPSSALSGARAGLNRLLGPLLLAAALLSAACSTLTYQDSGITAPVTAETNREIRVLLDKLYQSFNHEQGQEPDWTLMRSCFVDGALFAPEPEVGKAIQPSDVDALLAKWQASIRKRASPSPGYTEWIESVQMHQAGDLVRADVVFYAKESGDRQPRQPGLDSLQLVQVDGQWKVLSFVVQRESKPQVQGKASNNSFEPKPLRPSA